MHNLVYIRYEQTFRLEEWRGSKLHTKLHFPPHRQPRPCPLQRPVGLVLFEFFEILLRRCSAPCGLVVTDVSKDASPSFFGIFDAEHKDIHKYLAALTQPHWHWTCFTENCMKDVNTSVRAKFGGPKRRRGWSVQCSCRWAERGLVEVMLCFGRNVPYALC